jgi:hypothetical protein
MFLRPVIVEQTHYHSYYLNIFSAGPEGCHLGVGRPQFDLISHSAKFLLMNLR